MIGWSASTLQSSTRSGFVTARRWQSPQSCDATPASSSRSLATKAGRQFRSPTEFSSTLKSFNPAREELRLLDDRRANLVIVVGAEHLPRHRFHAVPHRCRGREQVPHSFYGANHS